MRDCPFCAFLHRSAPAPADLWWHSSNVVSFTPLNPVTDGHRLFIPTDCVPDAGATPGIAGDVMMHAAAWADEWRPFNIITSAGSAATQTVFHLHLHVVPRRDNDGLALPWTGQGEG